VPDVDARRELDFGSFEGHSYDEITAPRGKDLIVPAFRKHAGQEKSVL
jgi:hypothetical protein